MRTENDNGPKYDEVRSRLSFRDILRQTWDTRPLQLGLPDDFVEFRIGRGRWGETYRIRRII